MNKTISSLGTGLALLLAAGGASANDFPTVDRFLYVNECVRDNPGHFYEMANKCSCAADALAKKIKHAEYVSLSTAANANSIGGERGGYIRDNEGLQKDIKRYRELQATVKKQCFVGQSISP
jgi:hypothetical protein